MKRFIDITLSLLGCLVLSPLILIISLLVFVFLGRPIFFVQSRAGYQEKTFYIIKFRTMKDEKELGKSEDELRLTKFGNFLRSTSLDEIPELINVIKGDMSLVGPRPLLKEYLKLYNTEQRKRHDVLPGITGWAQVNGRNDISWEKKFDLDLWYVENNSLYIDIKILVITIFHILKRKGINQKGHATSKKFKGNKL